MLTVIIASHNGKRVLPLTLEALEGVEEPPGGLEIFVVNNASTDGTSELLAERAQKGKIYVIDEPRQGKSYALNTGLEHSRGDLIVFADDDIIPAPGWLKAYQQASEENPGVSLFAGQVRHYWQVDPPEWLVALAREGRAFAGTPQSLPDGPIDSTKYIKGLNFMVRREVIDHIAFCEASAINFTGQSTSTGGEDTDFVGRALANGYLAYHVPAACVRHIVRPEQIGMSPVIKRYFRIGRAGIARNQRVLNAEVPHIFGYPRYIYRQLPLSVCAGALQFLVGKRYKAASKLVDLAESCGRAYERKRLFARHRN